MSVQTKSLNDCHLSAVKLCGLTQAAAALFDLLPTGNGAVANGIVELLDVLVQKAGALADDLDVVERELRK
ncbi:hypothetical protein RSWS8N_06235 [Cereibacter sphaeroides WS8N]|uniref:hypothetical protein n=1 Tax=Cereibacter sphaeroides TaxID=1063 RepID=UPI00020DF449|nr:hypothetical protein [Cereibacter sphaeroides]EGJ21659.1 hypothetical protein RSWS8N_06235 [Cereibacter sphaeroides WS8N]